MRILGARRAFHNSVAVMLVLAVLGVFFAFQVRDRPGASGAVAVSAPVPARQRQTA